MCCCLDILPSHVLLSRYIAISRPFLTLQFERQRGLARLMVSLSWLVSLLLSSLQAAVFSQQKHPQVEFYQCTARNSIESFSQAVTDEDGNIVRTILMSKQYVK